MCWHRRLTWICHGGHSYDWVVLCNDGRARNERLAEPPTCGNADSIRTTNQPIETIYDYCRAPVCCATYTSAAKDLYTTRRESLNQAADLSAKEMEALLESVESSRQDMEKSQEFHDYCRRKQVWEAPVV